MILLVIVFILSALLALCVYVKKRQSFWADNGIPHEEPKFPMGNLSSSGGRKENFLIKIANFYHKGKSSGRPFYGLYFLHKPIVLATDLDFIRTVMIKDFNVFVDRGEYTNEKRDPLMAHLVHLESNRWRDMRSKLSPTFTSGKMKYMFPTIVSVSERLVDCLREMVATDNEVEVRDLMARFTTDVIGSAAFGIECNSLNDPNTIFRQMGKKIFDTPKLSLFERTIVTLFMPLARLLNISMHHKDVTDFFLTLVRDTVDYREKNNINRNDFMDLLIKLKNKEDPAERLQFIEIAPQAFSFFAAGFETSSTLMTFILYELAQQKNQHIQVKAREEVTRVLEKYNGELTYESLNDMVYIDQIINETLRKYPPASAVARVPNVDYQYGDMSFKIPKGTRVFISVYGIHHDPEYYPNPEAFIPERFSPEEVAKRHSSAFLPFGDGPRNCIGMRFGKMQAKIGLVTLVKNFKFSTCERTAPQPIEFSTIKVILSPLNGMWLKVNSIEH